MGELVPAGPVGTTTARAGCAVGLALGVFWKERLKDKLSTEDLVVVLELLIATLSLTIAIWANDNDARSPETRDVAAAATILIGIALVPWVGYLVRNAYDPDLQPPFTKGEAWWANACGGWIFAVTYFFTHV